VILFGRAWANMKIFIPRKREAGGGKNRSEISTRWNQREVPPSISRSFLGWIYSPTQILVYNRIDYRYTYYVGNFFTDQ